MCMMMMGMLGAGVSAMGAIAQGNAKAQADEIQAQEDRLNAQLDQRQAAANEIAGQVKQRRMVEQQDALAGRQIAATGASGLALTGSPVDVITDSRREGALDVAAVKYSVDQQSDSLMYKARIGAWNADQADQAASQERSNAMLGAFGSILGGATKMFDGGGFGGGGGGMFGGGGSDGGDMFGGASTSLGFGF